MLSFGSKPDFAHVLCPSSMSSIYRNWWHAMPRFLLEIITEVSGGCKPTTLHYPPLFLRNHSQ